MLKIRKRLHEWWIKKKLRWAVSLLRNINVSMRRIGWSRQRRRQFWRDFSKSKRLQNEIYNGLLNGKH